MAAEQQQILVRRPKAADKNGSDGAEISGEAPEKDRGGTPVWAPPVPKIPKIARTLEDLYHAHQIGGHSGAKLRVSRLRPTHHQGWLGDVDEPITMAQFKERWGGGVYTVDVIGNVADPVTGDIHQRALNTLEIRIEGSPVQDNNMMNMQPMLAPQAQVEEIKTRARREDREYEERNQKERAQDTVLQQAMGALAEQSKEWLGQQQQMADRQHDVLRQQNTQLLRELDAKENRIRELQAELLGAHEKGVHAASEAEHKERARLTEQHARDMAMLRDSRDREIRDKEERYRTQLTEQSTRHSEQITQMSANYKTELERMRSDMHAERERLRDDSRRQLEDKDHYFQDRIQSLEKSFQRELTSLAQNSDVKLHVHQELRDNSVKLAHERIELLQSENQRLIAENDRLKEKLHKEPVEAVQDARTMIEAVGGRVVIGGGGDENCSCSS